MSDQYAAERGMPSVPSCARSPLKLSFNGRHLTLSGAHCGIDPAVSGQPDRRGRFDYSPARQREAGKGPIPPGEYWIQPSQLWENHGYRFASRDGWGDDRITIHIYPGTQTFNRGGFFIHGGTRPGSAGCIDLHVGMNGFVKDLKKAMASAPDGYISLIVRY